MKVITAIGLPEINEKLQKDNSYEVVGRDIQYQEGILEILEEKEDIDCVILSDNLPEEIEFCLLISKIIEKKENIEIIVFLKEKNERIEMFLNSKKIFKIYYLENYEQFFNSLDKKEDINKNIEDFKRMILEDKKIGYDFNSNIKELESNENEEYKKELYLEKGKIISIAGVFGSGKSIISVLLSKYLSKYNKVLLIDADSFNNSINTILGTCKKTYKKGTNEVYTNILKYEENLHILNLSENNFESADYFYIVQIFEKIKEKYDFIIIDTSSDLNTEKNKIIFSESYKIVTLVEPNLSEVKKTNLYLEKILRDFEIEVSKINIIFNKINKYRISNRVLKEIYSELDIIGEIEYSEKYNLIINKNIFKESNSYESIFRRLLE